MVFRSEFHSVHSHQSAGDVAGRVFRSRDHRPGIVFCGKNRHDGHAGLSATAGSTFKDCLPIFKKWNISAVNRGLVSGKTQTIFPWHWTKEKGMPAKFFHDVFHPDGMLLYPGEKKIFDAMRTVPSGKDER